jgi:hypothetical protein
MAGEESILFLKSVYTVWPRNKYGAKSKKILAESWPAVPASKKKAPQALSYMAAVMFGNETLANMSYRSVTKFLWRRRAAMKSLKARI